MTVDPYLSAGAIAAGVAAGTFTAEAVTASFLARLAAVNPLVNAYTDILAERALATARALDQRRAAGETLGPLAGVPFAVKNLFDIAGLPTRAGSRINRERPPAAQDSVLIRRLEAQGAVLLGGLNMGEYAYDFTGENAHDGACRNPHDLSRISGGSSSGCGAATAAGLAPLSLGSDTNGSIRVPSSLCGIFGLKPTYGRLPRSGTFPFCDSLDHLGPFARSVGDLALAYDALQGFDPEDHACARRPAEPVLSALDQGLGGLRLAVAEGYFSTDGLPAAAMAVHRVAEALAITRRVELPLAAEGRAAAFLITNAEGAQLHLDRLRRRADDFDPDTRDRFLAGALLPAAWLVRAQAVRRHYHAQMMALFETVDVIIAPATPTVAPPIGQRTMMLRGREVLVRPSFGLFTQPISAIGLPVCAVPLPAVAEGLPIAVQVIAAPWREDHALRVARVLEQVGVGQAVRPAGVTV